MRRIGFIAFPNFQVLSLSTLSVFECANMLAPEPLYDLRILSETGGPIRTSSGLALELTIGIRRGAFADSVNLVGTHAEGDAHRRRQSPGIASLRAALGIRSRPAGLRSSTRGTAE